MIGSILFVSFASGETQSWALFDNKTQKADIQQNENNLNKLRKFSNLNSTEQNEEPNRKNQTPSYEAIK